MDREREPGTARFGNFINYYSFNPAERRIKLLPDSGWSGAGASGTGSACPLLDHILPLGVSARTCRSECKEYETSARQGRPEEVSSEKSPQKLLILDIGSNAGDLTAEVYRYFQKGSCEHRDDDSLEKDGVKSCLENEGCLDLRILGVDLDERLVERSNAKNPYPRNIDFKVADVMNISDRKEIIEKHLSNCHQSKFNLIMCFSVTLWIHLNHGDQGLQAFLKYLSKVSHYLLIEPQPWKCYRTAVRRMKKLKCEPFEHFSNLQWRENVDTDILDFLVSECGMVLKETYGQTEWDRRVCLLANKEE